MPGIYFRNTTAGAALQQNTCGTSQLQQWQFQPAADSGYYQVVNRSASSASNKLVWDVTGGEWADGGHNAYPTVYLES